MFHFLPAELQLALRNFNINFISEIRLRKGQAVMIEYRGAYIYINQNGVCSATNAIICNDLQTLLSKAMDGNVYRFSEQLKNGFITVGHGMRIGVAGEYVTESGKIKSVTNVTSVNVRIPHDVIGCANGLMDCIFLDDCPSTLLFSPAGAGKTTLLRDLARGLGHKKSSNVLIFDERNEISALDSDGFGFDLGCWVDVIRCADKLTAIQSAMRALKPQIIITDELYGEADFQAMEYVKNCGVCIIASTHISDKSLLQKLPFDCYVEMKKIGEPVIVYDKNFDIICNRCPVNGNRCSYVVE